MARINAVAALLFTTTIVIYSCKSNYLLSEREAAQLHISPTALQYFNEAFIQVSRESYRKKEIDFKQLYQASISKMDSAVTWKDAYPAIKELIAGLQDRHSYFQPPATNGKSVLSTVSEQSASIPFNASIADSCGIIELKSYNAIDLSDRHRVADSLYAALKQMDNTNVKGVIIDFRKMEGGTPVPFLTGFAPLINQDILLKYVDNKNHASYITRYKNGIYTKNGRKTARLGYLSDYAPLLLSRKPIAIITGKYTASAGEMILIAFLGLPNVKTFGVPTYGVATGKSNIFLADSAFISLASSVTCDRNGKAYTGSLSPAEYIDPAAVSEEQLRQAIRKWMQ
ncbi:S41 family peptidase [Chitinophaga sp. Hz27]|uniref:S41 family peptidase n=1 Tax=Chitinophaga sp. Hz27 TaxID=3347169 RepID=UPI0035D5FBAC